MKCLATTALSLSMAISGAAMAEPEDVRTSKAASTEALSRVSPALANYQRQKLQADLWQRPALSPRDRSMITVAAIIARNQTALMTEQFNLALDNGVKASELSEIITHLAFYSGWGNAMSAVAAAQDIFQQRGITAASLPTAQPELLPLNQTAEQLRLNAVEQSVGSQQFPGLVAYTTDVLFRDLWLRPALAPRDRSLITVSALIAAGQVAQVTFHLNKAMDNGLTQEQAAEVVTHLAFYVGWPNAMSAVPMVKAVFAQRNTDTPAKS
ncbi:putative decarboxylase [Yersinia frederiksenii]|uniref:carboxymuconolactone decarboxylase family protein n=1 Tax=Yersinia alsatica TaxID=2890317 RepID=UPI0005E6BD32|nr:carboxymuconolactone decarboxylase family protein [Yersinia alsatica]OWF78298.1 4-carboxymuconolactone decarboxylase [Yersinia frederiksenii]CFQ53391.1 putative decarboxylase [Yersinia frederiksenii]CNH80795.1 putative decarboxylase [Yersinia frederiksenii]CNI16979.1 putative decarboxylase [Yersinia frederiksenii]